MRNEKKGGRDSLILKKIYKYKYINALPFELSSVVNDKGISKH